MPMQVEGNEVAWYCPRFMPDKSINLESPWTPVMHVIHNRTPPIPDELSNPEQQHRYQHTEHKIDRPHPPYFAPLLSRAFAWQGFGDGNLSCQCIRHS